MKVGDLVATRPSFGRAPWLMDHKREALGVVLKVQDEKTVLVAFSNDEGIRVVFPHLLEVVNESR